ncbi:coniferyl-aldehyde dehydrogenase [Rhizobium sp. SG_E_25_P2]|uniref:coniferyl aldehyde dehydrogenase n=1 Tax=Rhizobium sp. SG_E_25_P2 TaxID=2879942 RepID=UPI002476B190|nr:coniferyl aldehyde dehydrogenase [Rhizobium sp. SG_E_25_P2]MDH6267334.1 coniferyl-aldehyde dehydrogenase [Rhizobium sp. SG_E_25_P2]
MTIQQDRPQADDATQVLALTTLLARQQAAYRAEMTPSLGARRDRLDRLEAMLIAHQDEFARAIDADFGRRDAVVTGLTETMTVRAAIRHARRHLKSWMKPKRVGVSWAFQPGQARIQPQPLGVVGIIAPWNYPLQLLLNPLVGALAAGNRAMLKPSEYTPVFGEALRRAVAGVFREDEVAVVTGGAEVATAFTALPFDHLIFTGSTSVGRKVAEAAGRNLTPVTLELGGKSPAIIDNSADMKLTASRLAWGKLLNSGQTCVAPDYVLTPRNRLSETVEALKAAMLTQYPSFAGNPDYTSIIAPRHYERLKRLAAEAGQAGAEVIWLGEPDDANRVLPPALILGATPDMAVMREEIFGPLLPVLPYDGVDEAIARVNDGDRPLALYWFGADAGAREKILENTISGGVTINDVILHLAQDGLPFGGVGASGYGHYHGEHGFRALSKEKPVFIQSRFSAGGLLYPPYGALARRMLEILKRFS